MRDGTGCVVQVPLHESSHAVEVWAEIWAPDIAHSNVVSRARNYVPKGAALVIPVPLRPARLSDRLICRCACGRRSLTRHHNPNAALLTPRGTMPTRTHTL